MRNVLDTMAGIFKWINRICYLAKVNFFTLLIFEVIYKCVAVFVFKPLLQGLLALLIRTQGFTFVADNNFKSFLTSPLIWVGVVVALFLISLYMLFDICCIVSCFHASYRNQKLPLLEMMRRGYLAAVQILRPKNYRMILYLLLIIPMSQLFTVSGVYKGFSMPYFVMQYISDSKALLVCYFIACLYVELVCMQWIFSFHHFTLNRATFVEASHGSRDMLDRKNLIKMVVIMIIGDAIMILAYYGLLYGCGAIIALLTTLADALPFFLPIVAESAVAVMIDIVAGIFYCFSMPYVFLLISGMFYYLKEEQGRMNEVPGKFKVQIKVYLEDTKIAKYLMRRKGRLVAFGIAVTLAGNVAYAIRQEAVYNSNVETYVTAHRGASADYPENTIVAFEGALEEGADEVEMDVHLSSDGEPVVIHDANLKRTTGLDANVWELKASEIEALDAGKWFSEEFEGVTIPAFEEVLETLKDKDIKLNVELKPDEATDGLAEKVIDLITEYDMQDQCLLSSLSYSELEDAKAYDESFTTLYISTISYGNISELDAADGFSLEASMVTRRLIKKIHKNNKLVYVWTVNAESMQTEMFAYYADGIITDDVKGALSIKDGLSKNTYWENYVQRLVKLYEK
ncbi:glycerophosphodiester phosphodiesterase family protein [Eubacterium oxidoreducens]|uniref:Glycerophosphoryl diester phosphodiesterase n=1 Tax=Eubacterium oxidoreducens TaxID=1732 RepID=A0A1G6BC54_EUBOX|nr:glycerophosphodiester phosphodiesterase family protein [Eubacterium oxidoreducens]SDB18129.1 glycerophosphoryl diester phosphodiesterase [Eubacterium oxidoreducens]